MQLAGFPTGGCIHPVCIMGETEIAVNQNPPIRFSSTELWCQNMWCGRQGIMLCPLCHMCWCHRTEVDEECIVGHTMCIVIYIVNFPVQWKNIGLGLSPQIRLLYIRTEGQGSYSLTLDSHCKLITALFFIPCCCLIWGLRQMLSLLGKAWQTRPIVDG